LAASYVFRVHEGTANREVIEPFLRGPSRRTSCGAGGSLYPATEAGPSACLFRRLILHKKENEGPISNIPSFSWPWRCLSSQGNSAMTRQPRVTNQIRSPTCSLICLSSGPRHGRHIAHLDQNGEQDREAAAIWKYCCKLLILRSARVSATDTFLSEPQRIFVRLACFHVLPALARCCLTCLDESSESRLWQ
jgi:hypothetical protein